MPEQLVANFVDGSGAVIEVKFDEKRVVMNAYDEKTRHRYLLYFTGCRSIRIDYSTADEESADLFNLTEGVQELVGTSVDTRIFRVGFMDESQLEIHCTGFSMQPIPGGAYDI